MANKVLLKKSSVAAKVPLTTDLDYGELALNYTDEKLYFKNASNVIKSFVIAGAGSVTSITAGTGLSGGTITSSGTIAIDSTVATLTGTQTLTNKTLSSAVLTGTLTAGGGVGTNGQVLTSTGTGVEWTTSAGGGGVSGIDHQTYTATAAQTTFAVAYTAPYVNVFVNGVRLSPADYTASNGTTVVLATACSVNDIVNLVGFSSIAVGYGLPSLTGNSGKYLTTDGSTVSWGTVAGGGGGTTTNALTIGTGLSGTSFDGSAAVTIAIDSTVATLTGTQTLTNKTLTSPVIGTIVNTGTLTLPTSTDTLVGRATTDTLTNKTLTAPTLNSVPTFSLRDTGGGFDLTIRSTSNIPLTFGRTLTIDVNNANPTLDIGGNITTANNFTTSGNFALTLTQTATTNVTLPTTGTLATLAGSETLTNKTLTSPVLGGTTTSAAGNIVFAPSTNILEIRGDGTSVVGQIQLNCPVNTHGQKIASQPHAAAATNTLTLPGGTTIGNADAVLVSDTGTQTLTNKTLSSAVLTGTVTAGGGVGTNGQVLTSTGTGVQWTTVGAEADTLATVTGRGATTATALSITNSTASTSSTTGALQVTGGIGIAGNSFFSGTIRMQNNAPFSGNALTISSSGGNTEIYTSGGNTAIASSTTFSTTGSQPGIQFLNSGGATLYGGNSGIDLNGGSSGVRVTKTTASTSSTTGALTVAGGVGVAGNIYVGTTLSIGTSAIFSGLTSGTTTLLATAAAGTTTLTLPATTSTLATLTGTETLTNKRVNPRVTSTASASSLTPDISVSDVYAYTALAANLTINAPTGTPVDGDKLVFRLLDNGTGRALTWNATYTAIGVTLPTTTTANKTTYVGCVYNANNTRWDVIAVTTEV